MHNCVHKMIHNTAEVLVYLEYQATARKFIVEFHNSRYIVEFSYREIFELFRILEFQNSGCEQPQ